MGARRLLNLAYARAVEHAGRDAVEDWLAPPEVKRAREATASLDAIRAAGGEIG